MAKQWLNVLICVFQETELRHFCRRLEMVLNLLKSLELTANNSVGSNHETITSQFYQYPTLLTHQSYTGTSGWPNFALCTMLHVALHAVELSTLVAGIHRSSSYQDSPKYILFPELRLTIFDFPTWSHSPPNGHSPPILVRDLFFSDASRARSKFSMTHMCTSGSDFSKACPRNAVFKARRNEPESSETLPWLPRVPRSSRFGGYGLSRPLDHYLAENQWEICCKCKVIHGNLPPNWRQLDSNVTSKEIGLIKDILSNLGQLGGNAGKLPWEAFPDAFVLYVHTYKHHPFTHEPPPSPRPVTRVLYREYVASEDIPPEPQFIAQTEPFRPAPVLYAHTAYSPIYIRFLFYASTTFRDLLIDFLLHLCTPFPGQPTHIAVYQRRTLFFHTS
ncbi:hypothetical protein B0H13DRAFT_1898532 [Mycena leptocephala]|nr:hypothetical protein B0H13DRAFT_1898532 [Mycena leptocephala]